MRAGGSKTKINHRLKKSVQWFRDWDVKNSVHNLKRMMSAANQENEFNKNQ